MRTITCTRDTLKATISIMRRGGERGEERVALWLAAAAPRKSAPIVEVYEPDQVAEADRFRLPPSSMRCLMDHLRVTRRRIVAQIHTHPGRAFHSEVDAEWAIVRHVGALSLVLPWFAATITPQSFLDEVATYEYSHTGDWILCPNRGLAARVMVTQ